MRKFDNYYSFTDNLLKTTTLSLDLFLFDFAVAEMTASENNKDNPLEAFIVSGTTQTGTAGQDYMFGLNNGPDHIQNGVGGNDLIVGDASNMFGNRMGNDSIANAFNIDNAGVWNTAANPLLTDDTIPHTMIYIEAEAEAQDYYSLTVGAGETISVDIDFSNFESFLQIIASDGTTVLADDFGLGVGADPGSDGTYYGTSDAAVNYTAVTGGTYYIVVSRTNTFIIEPTDMSIGSTTLLNVSVTNHAATAVLTEGNDIINGGGHGDLLFGVGGDDIITNGQGTSFMYGGTGDDIFIADRFADTIDGGSGTDTIDYSTSNFLVHIDLAAGRSYFNFGHGAGDNMSNIENIIGSTFADILIGDANANVLSGGEGVDRITGGDGDDTLYGGQGGPTLSGRGGDYLYGGAGSDFAGGGADNDWLYGGGGNDTLNGGDGDDTIDGGDGNDTLDGGTGNDTLVDTLVRSSTIFYNMTTGTFGFGANIAINFENFDGSATDNGYTVFGTSGVNRITGSSVLDSIVGGAGDDLLYGGGGDDSINGDAGDDIVSGGDDGDTISGNIGGDHLSGDAGDDVIYGGSGDDTILGGDGNDTLNGGAGNDTLDGGAGDDILLDTDGLTGDLYNGGTDIDTLDYSGAALADGVTFDVGLGYVGVSGGTGSDDTIFNIDIIIASDADDIIISNGTATVFGGDGDDVFTASVGALEILDGGNGIDTLDMSSYSGNVEINLETGVTDFPQQMYLNFENVITGAGDDIITGTVDHDIIRAGDGDDVIMGNGGNDDLYGEDGNDIIFFNGGGYFVNEYYGGEGTDTFTSTGAGFFGETTFDMSADEILFNGSTFSVWESFENYDWAAGTGDENIIGSDIANIITTGSGDNTISGGSGNDTLNGGAGNDLLRDGGGTDQLFGGAGDDTVLIIAGEADWQTYSDSFDGGDGTDTFIVQGYGAALNGTTFDMTAGTFGTSTAFSNVTNFENYDGSQNGVSNERVNGTAGNNIIITGGGDNTIQSGGGIDMVDAGAGNDIVIWDFANFDSFYGEIYDGGVGSDTLTVIGYGFHGSVTFDLELGQYTDGVGTITISNFENYDASGDTGGETVIATAGVNTILMGDGDNLVVAGDGNDIIGGGGGGDTLYGQGDDDTVSGGAGNDDLRGGLGDDTLNGDAGDDVMNGQSGNDTMNGGDGVDTMLGASGNDAINGELGNDTINGNGGDDMIDGGEGNDDLRGAVGFDTVNGGNGDDVISGGNQNDTLFGDGGADTLNGDAGNDIVNGGNDNDILIGAGGQDVLNGDAGDDSLSGDGGGDDLFGGVGDDVLNGGGGNDDLNGGVGADIFVANLGFRTDRVQDFEDGIDLIDFSGNSLAISFADIMADAVQVGANVRIELNSNNILVLENFDLADLDASDFIF